VSEIGLLTTGTKTSEPSVISDDGFSTELQEETGLAPDFPIESFADVAADVRQSILRVRHSPFLPHRDAVRAFVYDVNARRLSEVEAKPSRRSFI